MNRLRLTLPVRLTGIACAREADPSPRAPAQESTHPQPSAAPSSGPHDQVLTSLVNELSKLVPALHTRDHGALTEAARAGVELGIAIAERLVGEALAANRQRLDRAVLTALERMQPARQVVVRGHPDDMVLLRRQLAEGTELEPFRDLLALQADDRCARGQWKLETDDWFMEWDATRSLAELRARLLEETYLDD